MGASVGWTGLDVAVLVGPVNLDELGLAVAIGSKLSSLFLRRS